MDWFCWTLSADSLVAGVALSAVTGRGHLVPLAVLFGISDTVASQAGQGLGSTVALAWLVPAVLLLCGAVILLGRQDLAWRRPLGRAAYLLPPLMAMDNLLVPTQYPITAGCISGMMAALGFALGLETMRRLHRHAPGPKLPGVILVGAGLLLAF
jgi:hypothetical protein